MRGEREFRKEIQGLRAVAVLAVLVSHIRPWVLPGGYVGVDVFFVVSGYLITGLLLREVEATGGVSITAFYARRIRRLVPMATVVLLAVALGIGLVPAARWWDTTEEMIASAVYLQNRLLAARSTDYFASGKSTAVLRHFWSLSLEEQYCIFWPLLLIVGQRFAAFRRRPRRMLGYALAAVAAASLAWSIHLTATSPRAAYFSTSARAWEFALGGLLAVFEGWKNIAPTARAGFGLLGLASIAAAAAFFDESTGFPGHAALLPTAGAALIVMSGPARSRWSAHSLLASAPAQYVGDRSYSLYLWHWPVFAFFRQAGSQGGILEVLLVLAVCFALAHLSKTLVEDPFRGAPADGRSIFRAHALAACSTVLVLLAAESIRAAALRHYTPAGYEDLIGSADYPGAKVLTDLTPPPDDQPRGVSANRVRFLPAAIDAMEDQPRAQPSGCWGSLGASEAELCHYGDETSPTHLLLIGDSHAMQWVPALSDIADANRWRLTAITRSSCPFADVPVLSYENLLDTSCIAWNGNVRREVERLAPNAIVVAQSHAYQVFGAAGRQDGFERLAAAYAERWTDLLGAGMRVVVLADTPWMRKIVPECLTSFLGGPETCSTSRAYALEHLDPLVEAARRTPGVDLIDMNDAICGPETCDPVVGNVLVFRDSHHLTASYARTIAPALERKLEPVVRLSARSR